MGGTIWTFSIVVVVIQAILGLAWFFLSSMNELSEIGKGGDRDPRLYSKIYYWLKDAKDRVFNWCITTIVMIASQSTWIHVVILAALAGIHQLVLRLASPGVVLSLFMGNRVERLLLTSGLSKVIERITAFLRDYKVIRIALVPFAVYVAILNSMLTGIVMLLLDPQTTINLFWIVCYPLGVSLALWYLDEQLHISEAMSMLFSWFSDDSKLTRVDEIPTVGVRRRMWQLIRYSMILTIVPIFGLRAKSPGIVRMIMGNTIDIKIYIIAILMAYVIAGFFAGILLDGNAEPADEASSAKRQAWTDEKSGILFHRILSIVLIVAFMGQLSLPVFNNQFFAYRRMFSV